MDITTSRQAERVDTNPHGKYVGNEVAYALQVLDSENPEVRQNPFVGRLERAVAARFDVKHGIAQNSGTSTLHSALAAAGVGAGDEVISPAHTVVMCSLVTLHQNAIPVYADINPDTWNIDPAIIPPEITCVVYGRSQVQLPQALEQAMPHESRYRAIRKQL